MNDVRACLEILWVESRIDGVYKITAACVFDCFMCVYMTLYEWM